MKFILFFFISIILVLSCSRESSEPVEECFFPELDENLYALGIEENSDTSLLMVIMENKNILRIPVTCVEEYGIDSQKFTLNIKFLDGREKNIPYLGLPDVFIPDIEVNPSGYAPLTASLRFKLSLPRKVSISVEGKNEQSAEIYQVFEADSIHEIPVLGLYGNYDNVLNLSILNNNNIPIFTRKINIPVNAYKRVQSGEMTVVTNQYNESQKNRMFLLQNAIYDGAGDVRWMTTHTGNKFHKISGNKIAIQVHPDRGSETHGPDIRIIDIMGYTIDSFFVPNRVHHEIIEKNPGGNLLVATNAQPYNSIEDDTEDMIVEIDRSTGEIVAKWDMNDIFDPERNRLWIEQVNDWFHLNSIQYDSSDNTLLISSKLQYFISKIDYSTGEIKWILGDHENWKEPWKEYLLAPLNFDSTIHPDNDWPYSQHMPRITKNGTILVYDNGGGRPGGNLTRAVEYRVDPESMTVEKIWSYELDEFTSALGSIYRYEDNTIQIGHGNPGKFYEISYEGDIIFESFLYSYYRAYPITLY